MRKVNVAVAIVRDEQGQFLLTFNSNWKGYAFPGRDFDPQTSLAEQIAEIAVQEDLGLPLSGARAKPLTHVEWMGPSQRTGEWTHYHYHVIEVDLNGPVDFSRAKSPNGNAPRWLTYHQIVPPQGSTWPVDLTTTTPWWRWRSSNNGMWRWP